MSGFAGAVSLDGAPPDRELLQRMARVLEFRGPDATNIVTQPGAGFVFTFLRTGPAPQCPSQPCTVDGRTWLIGDIRLDGRDDLRLKLEQHGDCFDGEPTDEELVLRAWRRWGESALPELIGDYSFAVWDSETRRLVCARDLIGARPFFHAQAGGWFYFSNTLNAIRCSPAISSDLDPHFIGDFLLQGSCSYYERTAFRDVSRLSAGHTLSYSGTGVCAHRCAYFPVEEPLRFKRGEEYVEQFRALLQRAVLDRLPGDAVSIFMSGGLDSTSVAAISLAMAKKTGSALRMRAFTFDHKPLFDDKEGQLASLAASHMGIQIEIQDASSCLPFEGYESIPSSPEPCHDPFRRLTVEQYRRVAKHARVAFNGYGGDGVLTGQTWPYITKCVTDLKFREIILAIGLYTLKNGRMPPLRGGFRSRFRRWIKREDSGSGYPPWIAPELESQLSLHERWHHLQLPFKSSHPWYPKAHGILDALFLSQVVENEGPASTGVPVDSRAPLLDVRLQRFVLRVPPVPLCIDKEILRRAVCDSLPNEIRLRPKTPFQGDQVQLHVKKNNWTPFPLAPPSGLMRRFVDWERLETVLKESSFRFPWIELCPIGLSSWLRTIETNPGIQ